MALLLGVGDARQVGGAGAGAGEPDGRVGQRTAGRGLHSSTFQLNLSALYGIGGARRGSVARVKGVLGGVYGV